MNEKNLIPADIFVLLADGDGTLRSIDRPFGVAVTTENEAKNFVKDGGIGYSHSYCKIKVFNNKDEAIDWYKNKTKEELKCIKEFYENLSS